MNEATIPDVLYGEYNGGVDVLNIISGIAISDIEADAWALARRYEKDMEIG